MLNHAIEFTGLEETMRSLDVDARLMIVGFLVFSWVMCMLIQSERQI